MLSEAQRRFLWEAMRGLDPWDSEAPLRNPELQKLVAASLVEKRFGDDEDGDEVWWWQTTPAGRSALTPEQEGRDGHG